MLQAAHDTIDQMLLETVAVAAGDIIQGYIILPAPMHDVVIYIIMEF